MWIFSKIPFFQRNREESNNNNRKYIHIQNARLYEIRFVEFKFRKNEDKYTEQRKCYKML